MSPSGSEYAPLEDRDSDEAIHLVELAKRAFPRLQDIYVHLTCNRLKEKGSFGLFKNTASLVDGIH